MAEPADMILPLLREMREEIAASRQAAQVSFRQALGELEGQK